MLEPWIIEQIRRREEEERRKHERPRLEIPAPDDREEWREPTGTDGNEREDRDRDRDRRDRETGKRNEDKPERGVTIIDFGVA